MKRVVVTGMGAITPIGLNVAEFWEEFIRVKSALARLPSLILRIIR